MLTDARQRIRDREDLGVEVPPTNNEGARASVSDVMLARRRIGRPIARPPEG